MLKIEINGKSEINPNEEIRRQFREIKNNIVDEDDNKIVEQFYNVMSSIKEINPYQYQYSVQLIYQEVYCYFNYMKKSGETNINLYDQQARYLCAENKEEVIKLYESNENFFLDNFRYLLEFSDLFRVKMLLELNDTQQKHLMNISSAYLYDQTAISQYIGITSLEDFYYWRSDENTIIEEIVDEILYFLDYLASTKLEIYKKYISDILKKIYKWCCYYINYSIELEEEDIEVKVVNLVDNYTIDYICDYMVKDRQFLSEIITRILNDNEYGYQTILTENGIEDMTDEKLDRYMKTITRKSPK